MGRELANRGWIWIPHQIENEGTLSGQASWVLREHLLKPRQPCSPQVVVGLQSKRNKKQLHAETAIARITSRLQHLIITM